MTPPDKRRPTIIDVARSARVSVTTVSHALNRKGQVNEQTRRRVEEAARALGYHPNPRAQRLRTGQGRTIALMSSMPFGISGGLARFGFMMEVAGVAAEEAFARGLALVLVPPLRNDALSQRRIEIDGAILLEPAADDATLAWLRQQNLPVVCIGRPLGVDDVPYVDVLTALGTDMLLSHLWQQGARHIGLVIGSQVRNSYVECTESYRGFCAARGIAPMIESVDEAAAEAGGHRACAALLRRHPELDALLVPVDAFAVGALDALGEAGRNVPGDVRVATRYDGVRARTSRPPLTALDLHLEVMASQAVSLLFALIYGGEDLGPRLAPPPPALIVRDSSRTTGR